MAGGKPMASSAHKPSSSSSSHRKSRWEHGDKPPAATPNSKPTPAVSRPPPPPRPNPSSNPSPYHCNPPVDQFPHPRASVPAAPPPPPAGPPFPDAAPPQPSYGFHMLDRRTVVLADGSVRSYFALPPDYQDFAPDRRPAVDPSGRFLPYGPGGGPGHGTEGFLDDPFGRPRPHDYWNSLGLDGRAGPGEGSLKRKYGDDEDGKVCREDRDDRGDDFSRRRPQPEPMVNGFPFGPGGRGDLLAGTSSPYRRELMDPGRDDGIKSAKIMRGSGGDFVSEALGAKHHNADVDQVALKKAFLQYSKMIYENVSQRKAYLEEEHGHVQCLACGRSSKDFPDMHGLIMHTYNFQNADLRVDHLGLHKALCVLKGWNYLRPPDNSKVYQFLPANEATDNQDDLIMWPPLVIIHNTSTGNSKDGRTEGYGNKAMDLELRDLGFVAGKSKSLYSKEGHLGVTLVKFSRDMSGLKESMRLAEFFERENHGRKGWEHVQSKGFGKDDNRNPSLVQVDQKTGKRRKIFYGYLGTASDLAELDFETRKKTALESRREITLSN